MPTVKPLGHKNSMTLVEYRRPGTNIPDRVYLPTAAISQDAAGQYVAAYESLAMGIPYGVPWAAVVGDNFRLDAARLEEFLKQRGIWTLDDLRTHTGDAAAALQGAYTLDVHTLAALATKFVKFAAQEE